MLFFWRPVIALKEIFFLSVVFAAYSITTNLQTVRWT